LGDNPEECDLGGSNAANAYGSTECDLDCDQAPYCGDGETYALEEECDTSGVETDTCNYAGEGSPFSCTQARCGDGYINDEIPEVCDDGEADTEFCNYAGGSAPQSCTVPDCGDGYANLAAGEECDDGNMDPNDGCRNNCTLPSGADAGAPGADAGP
jgi:cysteine-rich repeat protein